MIPQKTLRKLRILRVNQTETKRKMFFKIYCDAPVCCCFSPRQGLLGWGYGKLVIDIIMVLLAIVPLVEVIVNLFFDDALSWAPVAIMYGILTTLWVTDTVYHAILVHGIRHNNTKLLRKYNKYGKFLWIFMIVLAVMYAIVNLNDLFWLVHQRRWAHYDKALFDICIMFVNLVFQSIAMAMIKGEIKKIDSAGPLNYQKDANKCKSRRFKLDFNVKLATYSPENKKIKEDLEEIKEETTCEKAKLTHV